MIFEKSFKIQSNEAYGNIFEKCIVISNFLFG